LLKTKALPSSTPINSFPPPPKEGVDLMKGEPSIKLVYWVFVQAILGVGYSPYKLTDCLFFFSVGDSQVWYNQEFVILDQMFTTI